MTRIGSSFDRRSFRTWDPILPVGVVTTIIARPPAAWKYYSNATLSPLVTLVMPAMISAMTARTRTIQTRIIEAAAALLARSVDGDVSTREICDAAGVTAPTRYHYFRNKEGLLRAVVDFGWTDFIASKRTVAAVVHDHVSDDIRAGWSNHIEFAQKHSNFYRLMWAPGVAPNSVALADAHRMLYDR